MLSWLEKVSNYKYLEMLKITSLKSRITQMSNISQECGLVLDL